VLNYGSYPQINLGIRFLDHSVFNVTPSRVKAEVCLVTTSCVTCLLNVTRCHFDVRHSPVCYPSQEWTDFLIYTINQRYM